MIELFQDRLKQYRDSLEVWNGRINLLGPEAMLNLEDHIGEALRAAEILRPIGEVLDFGSGGGLPAVPMAIVSPQSRFHFVESDLRKWAFLKHVIRECGLNSVAHGDRLERVVEKLDPELRFTLITSRAVGSPQQWLPSLRRFLTQESRVALFSGEPEPAEVAGFVVDRVERLPRGARNFLIVMKVFHVERNG